jgi:hypothetical protein
MKLPYAEGSWFAVPLERGGFGLGLVARSTAKGCVIFCYFFGPKRTKVPALAEVKHLKPADALRRWRVGDLGLIEGDWPIIGKYPHWRRAEWRMPPFVRTDDLSRKSWRIHYDDLDPNVQIRREPEAYGTTLLEGDGVMGSGAVELVLSDILQS